MSVGAVRELRAGTAAFGTFGTARMYLGSDLVEDFRRSHPEVRVRIVGQNSSETVDAIRDGELEAGLVVLPVDDRGLEIHPAMRDEVLYVSSDPARLRHAMTMQRLANAPLILSEASWGTMDPTRRQLRELAQRAGVVDRAADRRRGRRGRARARRARPRRHDRAARHAAPAGARRASAGCRSASRSTRRSPSPGAAARSSRRPRASSSRSPSGAWRRSARCCARSRRAAARPRLSTRFSSPARARR